MTSSSGVFKSLLGWLPGWVGFLFAMAAAVVALIAGIVLHSFGLGAFGVAGIISVVIAFFAGGKATPELNPFERSFGATIDGLDSIASVGIIGLFVIALLVAIFIH